MYSLNLFLYHMDADRYIVHKIISCACKTANGMSLTALAMVVYKITVIDSRELIRTDYAPIIVMPHLPQVGNQVGIYTLFVTQVCSQGRFMFQN